jgi:hypothetical protein
MVGKRLAAVLATIAAVVLIAAGCGSSDDESLTKTEFVKEGRAICVKVVKDLTAELKAFGEELKGKAATPKQMGEVAEDVVFPGLRVELEQLRELSPPANEEEKIAAILSQVEAGIQAGAKDPANFLLSSNAEFSQGREMAERYGLQECAQIS